MGQQLLHHPTRAWRGSNLQPRVEGRLGKGCGIRAEGVHGAKSPSEDIQGFLARAKHGQLSASGALAHSYVRSTATEEPENALDMMEDNQ